jgi:hypothetical protein
MVLTQRSQVQYLCECRPGYRVRQAFAMFRPHRRSSRCEDLSVESHNDRFKGGKEVYTNGSLKI